MLPGLRRRAQEGGAVAAAPLSKDARHASSAAQLPIGIGSHGWGRLLNHICRGMVTGQDAAASESGVPCTRTWHAIVPVQGCRCFSRMEGEVSYLKDIEEGLASYIVDCWPAVRYRGEGTLIKVMRTC